LQGAQRAPRNAGHWSLPRGVGVAHHRAGAGHHLRAHARHRAGHAGRHRGRVGFATGCIFHTVLAAVGIAALIRASDLAFNLVRYAGAAYLVWIGIQALRHRSSFSVEGAGDRRALGAIYRQSVIGNMLNPKVTLFFLAFLPQFVNTQAGHVGTQMALLGAIFMVQTIVIFGAVAIFSGWIGGVDAGEARDRRAPERVRRAHVHRPWHPRGASRRGAEMKFFDEARIEVIAGDGGDGSPPCAAKRTCRAAAPTAATAGAAAASTRWPMRTSTRSSTTDSRASSAPSPARTGVAVTSTARAPTT
jgi:threonine/homoserine/homoserine lactone efflux protein